MDKDLVIVESPAKARTIERFLGNKYVAKASMGHVRDLPRREIGVDVDSFKTRSRESTGGLVVRFLEEPLEMMQRKKLSHHSIRT